MKYKYTFAAFTHYLHTNNHSNKQSKPVCGYEVCSGCSNSETTLVQYSHCVKNYLARNKFDFQDLAHR